MRDFNIDDWNEVCQRMRANLKKCGLDDCLHTSDFVKPINEMAITIDDYRNKVIRLRRHIYNTISNVCCLEHISNATEHWKNELDTAFAELYEPIIKNKISKEKVLKQYLIEELLSSETYEPDDDDFFISAMYLEITKAKNENSSRKLKEAKYIEDYILPNITAYREANAKRIATLMKNTIKAILTKNVTLLEKSVQDFVDDVQLVLIP